MSDQIIKKKHKYIDSEEEHPVEQPQVQVQKKVIDQRRFAYLFEPDTSASEPRKQKAQPQKVKKEVTQTTIAQSNLEDLRYEILTRWWHCLGEWPPSDFNYAAALAKYKLRKVESVAFKREPEVNSEGFTKVYEIDGYPGVFRTSAGDTLDLRPKESSPTYDNIAKLNAKTLPKIYIKGLQAQLKELLEYEPQNTELAEELRKQISHAQTQYKRYLE